MAREGIAAIWELHVAAGVGAGEASNPAAAFNNADAAERLWVDRPSG